VREIVDNSPDVGVQPAEYMRLLGYPRGFTLEGRALELAEGAREWFQRNARPWIYARSVDTLRIEDNSIVIDGATFSSPRLRSTFQAAEARTAFLVAISAGPELEEEAQVRWRDGKPDEYFFLEVFGSAVVEHLVTMTGARLCAWADGDGAAVLPHYSPGYPDWAIDEQARLLELIRRSRSDAVRIEAMESGMLRPKKSLLAVFGVTRHVDRVQPLTALNPCERCSYARCQYRRVPSYHTNLKALKRWMDDRGVATVNLAYFGSVDPASYGVRATYLPSSALFLADRYARPRLPGYVAISGTALDGVFLPPWWRYFYAGLRTREPVAVIGNTMRVYWVDRWPMPTGEPLDPASRRTLAEGLLFGRRWPERALTHYDEYLKRRPADPDAWNGFSLALAQTGRTTEALAGFRRVLALSPTDPDVRRNIALLERQVAAEGPG